MPTLVQLTHHPRRLEWRTETVTLLRQGTSQTVSETVTVPLPNGGNTRHTISAYRSIPSATVQKQVTLEIEHPEHARAELVQRQPGSKARTERSGRSAAAML